MAVNYDDERFKAVEKEQQTALNNVTNTYNNMINNSDKYYQDMAKAAENYGKQQTEIQQANTDFAIEKINQQKEQAQKDYTKEQKGAYVDWQKQSNQYGVNAEQLASSGLRNTGYSESSQVSMYNTYQNRVSQARDTFNRATLEYDNGIKEAQLTNNAALAEIAYKTLQTKLELGLNQFNSKNQLLQQQLAAQQSVKDNYYNRWQDVLKQINTENALAEQQRQFNTQISLSKKSSSSSSRKSSSKGATITKGGSNTTKNGTSSSGGSWITNLKNNILNNASKNATNGVGQIQTTAGQNALKYLQNFVSGDEKNPKRLTKLDTRNIEKYLGSQLSGMTENDYNYITNYIKNNFSNVSVIEDWARMR